MTTKMHLKTALICALLTISSIDPVFSKKSFGRGGVSHSYPRSGGLSGSGGSHSYPKSPGLSGNSGGSHYPSSGGLSGGGSHGYPNSGGRGGLSGGGSGGYPNTHHQSNPHGYPASTGLSGNSKPGSGYPTQNNYHYNPPQQIHYAPSHGGPPVNYPVYHGTPPAYVYQYKDSGSKYGTLLTGLALLNLGTLGAVAYSQFGNSHSSHGSYKAQPGEVCKFGIRKENGDYEETKIDCTLISSFILAEEAKQNATGGGNTTTVITTVTNVTTTNLNDTSKPGQETITNVTVAGEESGTLYRMFPNGTLVPVSVVSDNATMANVTIPTEGNATDESANNTLTSSGTITTTNTTTVTSAVDVKGPPVEVTPGMKCYVIRSAPSSTMRKTVSCGLLQTYADKSIQKNPATRILPMFSVLAVLLVSLVV